jgi:hypothetical protein
VEYSDIFKVGLLVVGFLSGIALTLQATVSLFLDEDHDATTQRGLKRLAFGWLLFFILGQIAIGYVTGNWHRGYMTVFSWLVALWALLRVRALLMAILDISARRVMEGFLISHVHYWRHGQPG